MGKEKYIITIQKNEEEKSFVALKGERIMLQNRTFIVVGETPEELLPKNIRVEKLTKDNKYKVKKLQY